MVIYFTCLNLACVTFAYEFTYVNSIFFSMYLYFFVFCFVRIFTKLLEWSDHPQCATSRILERLHIELNKRICQLHWILIVIQFKVIKQKNTEFYQHVIVLDLMASNTKCIRFLYSNSTNPLLKKKISSVVYDGETSGPHNDTKRSPLKLKDEKKI